MNNVEIWLWILLVMLPHNSRTTKLLKEYGSALEAAKAMRDGKCSSLTPQEKQRVERTRTREVRALISECDRLGIRIVTLDDEEYPQALKAISDPPIVLFVKGSLAALNSLPALAVVGPRTPSEYGMKCTEMLCGQLAKDGVALVSGLAVGVDGTVHRCAVNNGGYTVGVLGCGIMVNYPPENETLKQDIIASGGAVVSELLPYASVSATYFRRRNRIISGMCRGTLVTEASTRSGSLLTAEHALDQGRVLMCVPPHDIFSEQYAGVFRLFRKGAVSVFDTSDIYRRLALTQDEADKKRFEHLAQSSTKISEKRSSVSKAPKTEPVQPEKKTLNFDDLSPEEAQVAQQLIEKPLTMDELIQITGISHDKMCAIVLGLELSDVVTRNQTGTFALN